MLEFTFDNGGSRLHFEVVADTPPENLNGIRKRFELARLYLVFSDGVRQIKNPKRYRRLNERLRGLNPQLCHLTKVELLPVEVE